MLIAYRILAVILIVLVSQRNQILILRFFDNKNR